MIYLSKETVILPKIEYSTTDLDNMKTVFEKLKNHHLHKGETLTVSDTYINLILKDNLDLENRFYIRFIQDSANVLFSLPIPFMRRFANGSCNVAILYNNGTLDISITDLIINDMLMSDKEMNSLEAVIKSYLSRNKRLNQYLQSISSVSIKNDTLYITFSSVDIHDNGS
ncbi:MAG: hypothetical protein RBU23_06100 [Candidatus Auribacterota bacterium]|jgi:hypothetical protein|nr:hypothetical protein [Candidatus Auribacterota bacterium]